MKVMTARQAEIARGLATDFDHEWARHEEVKGILDLEEMYRKVSALLPSWNIGGIYCPEMDEDGCLVHRTSTGRVGWRIHPNGDLDVTIYRPGDVIVVEARVRGEELTYKVGDSAYGRHVSAANDILSEIGKAIPYEGVRNDPLSDDCPNGITAEIHYRHDGTCRCDDPTHGELSQWGYELPVELTKDGKLLYGKWQRKSHTPVEVPTDT